jgi:hypothetical protein
LHQREICGEFEQEQGAGCDQDGKRLQAEIGQETLQPQFGNRAFGAPDHAKVTDQMTRHGNFLSNFNAS